MKLEEQKNDIANFMRNLKRVEFDDYGRVRALEFEDCLIKLDTEHADLLKAFVRRVNLGDPVDVEKSW